MKSIMTLLHADESPDSVVGRKRKHECGDKERSSKAYTDKKPRVTKNASGGVVRSLKLIMPLPSDRPIRFQVTRKTSTKLVIRVVS